MQIIFLIKGCENCEVIGAFITFANALPLKRERDPHTKDISAVQKGWKGEN